MSRRVDTDAVLLLCCYSFYCCCGAKPETEWLTERFTTAAPVVGKSVDGNPPCYENICDK